MIEVNENYLIDLIELMIISNYLRLIFQNRHSPQKFKKLKSSKKIHFARHMLIYINLFIHFTYINN
jgi:hypothetical protein